ncbi:sugar ABC transporter substrate-binding protein [Mycetocola tolaasinivorans]|uniref:Sugar ABC transporter substrate-binding protein n=1 Tax=Mycetocola tolaasinivorans TaxID=76635 RepID=A0A3L7A5J8_9MICO|nr:sugar ABC transporter substrate-binding protein [Mycetocola tolaasinivorans]RLP75603.1 sugar ABC transporter substrate-binding protein [Mycetocola tolaasinivorans]
MKIRILTAGITAIVLAASLTSCSSEPGGTDAEVKTITYWASNQGASLDNDAEILKPEIAKFEKQTGIKVKLEVVPWSDLTNNTLAAAVSGQGPDVINIGNTNAVTFQSTGAFFPFDDAALDKIGGKDRFIKSSFATTGAEGQTPTSIPLYSQVYGLYYNKKAFADKGLTPPATWEELVSAATALTDASTGKYGIVIPGGTVNASMHMAFIFGAQNGGSAFDKAGKPTFTSDGMVAGVKQYVDLLATDKVVNPSVAQYTEGAQAAGDFARGDAAMYMAQTSSGNVLAQNGMTEDQYGVVPIPAPVGGDKIGSFVAGTNISIFKSSKNVDAALEFVKFLTSDEEQAILNKAYTSLPVVTGVEGRFTEDTELLNTWTEILTDFSKPLPLVPGVQAFQANVGGAVVSLIAQAATGGTITTDTVRKALDEAEQKMGSTK